MQERKRAEAKIKKTLQKETKKTRAWSRKKKRHGQVTAKPRAADEIGSSATTNLAKSSKKMAQQQSAPHEEKHEVDKPNHNKSPEDSILFTKKGDDRSRYSLSNDRLMFECVILSFVMDQIWTR